MKDRLRKKIWKRCWFPLRLDGHSYWSFTTSDYRHWLNAEIRMDSVTNHSLHWRLK